MNYKHIQLPLSKADARSLRAGDACLLTGPVYTLRDAGHIRLLDEIREQTANGEKYLPQMRVDIHDGAGTLVARVEKTLYVRLKPQARQA